MLATTFRLPCGDSVQPGEPPKHPHHCDSASFTAATPLYACDAGYLPLDAGNDLLSTIQHHSSPGSHIIVTVPPGPAVKAARDKAQAAVQQQGVGREDSGADGADQEHPKVEMGEGAAGGVSTVQANMPHVTFEEPQDTLGRCVCRLFLFCLCWEGCFRGNWSEGVKLEAAQADAATGICRCTAYSHQHWVLRFDVRGTNDHSRTTLTHWWQLCASNFSLSHA